MAYNKPHGMHLIGIAVGIAKLALLLTAVADAVPIAEWKGTSNITDEVVPHITIIEKAGNPKMDQVLFSLANSENPGAFAKKKGLAIVEDKVRVIIILAKEENITGRFNLTIEVQDKNLVQALVPVDRLIELANESDINYIKVPEKFKLMEEKPRQSSFPSTFSWIAILAIFLFIKIRNRRKN